LEGKCPRCHHECAEGYFLCHECRAALSPFVRSLWLENPEMAKDLEKDFPPREGPMRCPAEKLAWIEYAIRGEPVSDFAASFSIVREAMDLYEKARGK